MTDPAPTYRKLQEAIVFIYEEPPDGEAAPSLMQFPHGTGFILTFPIAGAIEANFQGRTFPWIVTNKHVLHTHDDPTLKKKILLRCNNLDGQQFLFHPLDLFYEGHNQNVFFHPNAEVDLAAIMLPVISNFVPMGLAYQLIAGEDEFKAKVQVGTHICVAGYMAGYAGLEKNYPAVRFGRVSLLTEEKWYRTDRKSLPVGEREYAFVVEIPARGGASGSPVLLDVSREGADPVITGVAKGTLDAHDGFPQGLLAVEPASNLLGFANLLFEYQQARTKYKLLDRRDVPK